MSATRIVAVALGGCLVLAFLVTGARGKCQSWTEALLCVVGTIAAICGVVGATWLLMYGITGEWPS